MSRQGENFNKRLIKDIDNNYTRCLSYESE